MTHSKNTNLASPWMRILATFIDFVVFFIVSAILTAPFGAASALTTLQSIKTDNPTDFSALTAASAGTSLLANILQLIIYVLLFVVIPVFVWKGQTLGKKLLKLTIVRVDGGHVVDMDIYKRYSIPTAARVIALVPVLGCLACLEPIVTLVNLVMLFVDEKRQTVYDKIAQTIVVAE